MKKFREQNPTEIVTRCIILEQVRKINPFDLYKVKPYYANVLEEIDENGVETTLYETNWEYLLFDATLTELDTLLGSFAPTPVEEKSSLILPDKHVLIGEDYDIDMRNLNYEIKESRVNGRVL